MLSSLCVPDRLKSCFACCPPIRPAGYEHLDHKNIIRKVLLENRREYNPDDRDVRPVTGFSCWALGFIDPEKKQAGCLLHPCRNNGNDLRFRIDYGNKCLREGCREAGIFETLNEDEKGFWLSLTEDLDSFEYSSRKNNILFSLLGWGNSVLSMIADEESGVRFNRTGFLEAYPFFRTGLLPKGNAYLLTAVVSRAGTSILKEKDFRKLFETLSRDLISEINKGFYTGEGPVFVHTMDLDGLFSDFLRVLLNIKKSDQSTAEKIKLFTDNRLGLFLKGIKEWKNRS